MTVADWVGARTAGAPAPLVAALHAALGSSGSEPDERAGDLLLALAERRLAAFLPEGAMARDGATELLVIDALTTLALEAAAGAPDLAARSADAVRRLSALAERAA